MLEIVLALLFVFLILNIVFLWLKIVLLVVLLMLVIPGMYAMIFGAPFVVTRRKQLAAILKIGRFSAKDRVVELGCGDGRVIRAIAQKGVKEAVGYEFSVPTYLWAKFRTWYARGREEIRFGNFWKEDYSQSDVLICFLLKETMLDFEKKIWPKLKPGTRVISNAFQMAKVKPESMVDWVYLYVK